MHPASPPATSCDAMASEIKHRKCSMSNSAQGKHHCSINTESSSSSERKTKQHRPAHYFVLKRVIWAMALVVLFLLCSYVLPSPRSPGRPHFKVKGRTSVSRVVSTSHSPTPFSTLIANSHKQTVGYGATPLTLTGVYTLDEDFLLQKPATASENHSIVTGSIQFPLVDLSSLLVEESVTEYKILMMNRFSQISSLEHDQLDTNDGDGSFSKDSFLNKDYSFKSAITGINDINSPFPKDHALLTRCGYKMGEVPNQDRSFITNFDLHINEGLPYELGGEESKTSMRQSALLMGIFDGHGPRGHEVSHYIALEFAREFARRMRQKQRNQALSLLESLGDEKEKDQVMAYIKQALTETFLKVDEGEPVKGVGGSTASTLFYPGLDSKVYIANAGDSTTLIAKYSKSKKTSEVVFQNGKHKPHMPEERKRIEEAGGQVMIPPSLMGGGTNMGPIAESSRIIIPDKTGNPFGGLALAMSRSIGDYDGRHVGLIPEPTVDVWDVNDYYNEHHFSQDQHDDTEWFAIIASDGIYDLLSTEVVVEYLGHSLYNDQSNGNVSPLEACERLIRESSRRWLLASIGGQPYRDDITIGVSKLNFALN